ncbi:MAG: argininosuccinate lyase [Porphyromonadaceae bacterium]|nr:argininosuccinate lyase [Porphyromonadaceae bacterium]
MPQKLWEKNVKVNADIDRFTVGRDRELDLYLARYDILGSLAHITMLETIGLLTRKELDCLTQELRELYTTVEQGNFTIEEGVEDVHSQVELMLTRRLGNVGKKIHSGRSRNDQVLVDLKLFIRSELQQIVELTDALFDTLIAQSEKYKEALMPGYTHLQIAMPSSFGLWFGAYAESLVDDLTVVQAAYKVCNRNPLGSAAGYGSSFPLNRGLTTRLLGFDSMDYNVVYAQMGRGKTERIVASALGSIAATLSKLAFDACLFNSQNFGFIKLPDAYTTGSSIMPHKKNPDVFELTRAKCNKIQALPYQITLIANNLPSGYFRDLQIIKEVFLPMFDELKDCLRMVRQMMGQMEVNTQILDDKRYDPIFSVEEVNRLVLEGVPFRDAYKQVGLRIEKGGFIPNKKLNHTHEGSLGNLCNDRISALEKELIQSFDFAKTQTAFDQLLGRNNPL